MNCPKCASPMHLSIESGIIFHRCFTCGKRVYLTHEPEPMPDAPRPIKCSRCKKPMEFDGSHKTCPECRSRVSNLGAGICRVCGREFTKSYKNQQTCGERLCLNVIRSGNGKRNKGRSGRPKTSPAECLAEHCGGGYMRGKGIA